MGGAGTGCRGREGPAPTRGGGELNSGGAEPRRDGLCPDAATRPQGRAISTDSYFPDSNVESASR